MGDTDKTYKNIADCRERGIRILPPDVNQSREDFTVVGDDIRFGLGAVRGVGGKAIETILSARATPFDSFPDFCRRVRGPVINKRVIESLIQCGAFDSLGVSRPRLLAVAEDMMRWAERVEREATSDQRSLFGGAGGAGSVLSEPPAIPVVPEWSDKEMLRAEKEAIGIFLTGHPLDKFLRDLGRLTNASTGNLVSRAHQDRITIGGVIHTVKLKNSKKGDRYATFALEDKEGAVEVIAWPDTYRRHEDVIQGGAPVVVAGALEISEERCQIIVDEITPLSRAHAEAIRQAHVRVPLAAVGRDALADLRAVLAAHPGPCDTFLHLVNGDENETILALPPTLRVAVGDQIVNAVERLLGAGVMYFR
jgi:DNA polymerase-3 subunit alpha